MTRAEAWSRLRRERWLREHWNRDLARINDRIDRIRAEMELSIACDDARLVRELADNRRYRETVDAFLNYRSYAKRMSGWRAACGTDVGLFRKTSALGWTRLWPFLLRSRKERR